MPRALRTRQHLSTRATSREIASAMANSLGFYNPALYANEALIYLTKGLGMASRVHMGFDEERRTFNKGDTINIKRPSVFTAAAAPSTAADVSTESLSITLGTWQEVKFKLTDKELAYTTDKIITDHIGPAAYALADKIDQDLAALAYEVGPATTASSTYAVADLTAVHKVLFTNQCPMRDASKMHFMIGGTAQKDLLDLAAFTQWQGAGAVGVNAQATGTVGQRYGFNFFANQNVNQLNYSAFTLTTPTVSANTAKGSTSLAIAATTVNAQVIPKGFSFTIAGDTQVYAVTANVTVSGTAGATVAISPALQVAATATAVISPHASTPIAGVTTKDQNLAFHHDAFALAMARLPDYGQFGSKLGMDVASVQDPVTGISVRSRIYAVGNSSEVHVALDVLYGVKTLNPNMACRMRAN